MPLSNRTIWVPDFHHPHSKNINPGTPSQNSRERYQGLIIPFTRP